MKKVLLSTIMFIFTMSTAISLEPIKIAIVYSGIGTPNVVANVHDYSSNSQLYTESYGGLTANSSGIITFSIGINQTNWQNLTVQDVNSSVIVDVILDGTLYAQYRLDQLILTQAQAALMNVTQDGSLIPDDPTQSLGTNEDRWSDLFVGPSSVHIGQPSAEGTIRYDVSNQEIEIFANGTEEVVIGQTFIPCLSFIE